MNYETYVSKMKKTKLKTTHRKDGWTTLITLPWGEKIRIIPQENREDSEKAAIMLVERKRNIENDPKVRLLLEV